MLFDPSLVISLRRMSDTTMTVAPSGSPPGLTKSLLDLAQVVYLNSVALHSSAKRDAVHIAKYLARYWSKEMSSVASMRAWCSIEAAASAAKSSCRDEFGDSRSRK